MKSSFEELFQNTETTSIILQSLIKEKFAELYSGKLFNSENIQAYDKLQLMVQSNSPLTKAIISSISKYIEKANIQKFKQNIYKSILKNNLQESLCESFDYSMMQTLNTVIGFEITSVILLLSQKFDFMERLYYQQYLDGPVGGKSSSDKELIKLCKSLADEWDESFQRYDILANHRKIEKSLETKELMEKLKSALKLKIEIANIDSAARSLQKKLNQDFQLQRKSQDYNPKNVLIAS